MRDFAKSFVSLVSAATILTSCGGGGTNPPPPPPPPPTPANVVKQPGGDNQAGTVGQPVATAPAVKVTTATGAAVAGVTVTFAVASGGGVVTGATPTTGADGVATVGSWTLGPAAGPNTLTATAAGSGIAGNPATFTVTGALTSFNPTSNTTLSGIHSFTTINIPAGVTVTMTGDLTLNATGAVTIAGNFVGDCVALTINAEGALTVSGNLNNGCSGAIPAGGPPAMTLVGKGGYTLNAPGAFTAGGDVTITNDPTLADANFAPGAAAPVSKLRWDGVFPSVGEPCVTNGYNGMAKPATAKNGTEGSPNGTNGADGATWTLRCKGGSDIVIGGLTLTGQNGGKGGNGTHSTSTAAVSGGGDGGKGGAVRIQALGSIVIGLGSSIRTGNGGDGGSATADGSSGHGGTVGGSGTATGGAGGSPGLFAAVAKTGGIALSTLNLQIGAGGRGGDASAIGGDGHDALPCPAAVGGPATATAGAGGSTPDKTLTAAGAVTGTVDVTGGKPGNGGDATANAGKGGAGAQPCKPGAVGGAPTAKGGKGGDADLKDQTGTKLANGGNGGSMEVKNGKGGQGWIDCILPTFEPGGAGGMGGSIAGFNGQFGTGLANGNPGPATYTTVANGGNGGDGQGPGAGGPAGGNGVALNGGVTPTIVAPSFLPGTPGALCGGITMLITPPSQTVAQGATGSVHIVITRTGNFTGTVTIQIKDQGGTVRGSGSIPSGSTQTDVSFTVPATEPAGNRNWTVTGSGSGIPLKTEILALTITGTGGSVNLVIRNFEQATAPSTKFLFRIGNDAYQNLPIAPDGSTIVAVPTVSTPTEVDIQQAVGNDRITYVYQMSSTDLLSYGYLLSNPEKTTLNTRISGAPANSMGASFAGRVTAPWPATNSSPFDVPLSGVETGVPVVNGCALSGPTQEPVKVILDVNGFVVDPLDYLCDLLFPGKAKSTVASPTTVTGVSPGTQLFVSGGYHLDDIQTTLYSKTFTAPTTDYYALNSMDLPPGVLQWERLGRTTASTHEGTTYYPANPLAWTTPLPPALNTPAVAINSIFNGYFEFDIFVAIQFLFLGAWFTDYTQANSLGGLNQVRHLLLRSFLPSSLPSTIHMKTPTSMLLDQAYMPKPGAGMVSGRVCASGHNVLTRPLVNSVRNEVCRVNMTF